VSPSSTFRSALLVEDEPNLARALQIALEKLGIGVEHAPTLRAARAAFSRAKPELILLDRGLPDGDGLDLCARLRDDGFRGAILVLTAAGRPDERVRGLESGADDYLAKPFSWDELTARVRALARRLAPEARAAASPSEKPESAPWDRDESRLRILGPAGWVQLTPLEFKLASHLMAKGGAIVTRDELLKEVWGFTLLPKTRTVDHFLGRLRKLFEEDAENPRHFLTVRGAGYRFVARG
jgi:two-component system KDP operon response regulator KdpE